MITFRELNWLSGFAKVDLKGFGRWLLATIILSLITGRMRMQIADETMYMNPSIIIYIICFGIYGFVYNLLSNRPQFTSGLPYTSRQEVNRSITMLVGFIIVIFIGLLLIFGVITAVFYFAFDTPPMDYPSIPNFVFALAYYLFVTALLFPLGMIYDKKKWYLVFASVAAIIGAVSLLLINLMPGAEGFRTYGMVFENARELPHSSLLLTIMMVVAVGTTIASYHIAQRLHAPKKYT